MQPESIDQNKTKREHSYQGFDIKFKDLLVWVPDKKKSKEKTHKAVILKGVSSDMKSGTMTAIIGPSGAGKTTLLNFLSGRQESSQQFETYCKYYINDTEVSSLNEFKNIIGYVLQDDIMDTRLSPRQLFEFYGQLRGIRDFKSKANEIINDLNLVKCADTVVGDTFSRGISGGEKKRTSIGIELVSDPNLLFLDEPTTGLDSSTALDIIKTIADLRDKGITIITTIHQPSEEIMKLFDKILVVGNGNILYDDSPQKISEMLNRLNFLPPKFDSVIEYFMKIIDKDDIRIEMVEQKGDADELEVDQIYSNRIDKFINEAKHKALVHPAFKELEVKPKSIDSLRSLAESKNKMLDQLSQMKIFLQMYISLFFKDFFGIVIKSILFWFTFIILLVLFIKKAKIDTNPRDAIQDTSGFYFMFLINLVFGGATVTSTLFIPQKLIYMKDRQSRLYSKFAFFISNNLYVVPFYLVNVTIAIVIYFYAFELNNNFPGNLAWIWAMYMFIGWMGGAAIGMFISMIVNSVEDTGPFLPLVVLPQVVIAGFFANIKTIGWPLFLFSYITPVKFAYQGLLLVEFSNSADYLKNCVIKIACPNDQSKICFSLLPPEKAQVCDPRLIFDFYETDIWLNFVVGVAIVVGWQIMAYLLFIFRFREKSTNYGFDQSIYDTYCREVKMPEPDKIEIGNNQNQDQEVVDVKEQVDIPIPMN